MGNFWEEMLSTPICLIGTEESMVSHYTYNGKKLADSQILSKNYFDPILPDKK